MDPQLINIIVTIAGVLWGVFKVTKFYKDNKDNAYLIAIECVAAGALTALDAFSFKKEGGENVKNILTSEDKARYKKMAKVEAVKLGNKSGINIVNTLGGEAFLDFHLENQLKRLI